MKGLDVTISTTHVPAAPGKYIVALIPDGTARPTVRRVKAKSITLACIAARARAGIRFKYAQAVARRWP